jgi:hypothetical protein
MEKVSWAIAAKLVDIESPGEFNQVTSSHKSDADGFNEEYQ